MEPDSPTAGDRDRPLPGLRGGGHELTTANLPDANASHPGVMQVLGAEDGLIPIDGGRVGGHVFLSANDSIATWVLRTTGART